MSLKYWTIEGNSQKLDGGSMFGNVPRALWQRWIEPDDQHRIPLACRALLVEGMLDQPVLFETGIGSFFEPKLRDRYGVVESEHRLLASLEACGFSHEEVGAVVLSHLHFDHAGGLLSSYQEGKAPGLLFPNARFIVGEQSFERARNPHPRDRASFISFLPELLEQSGRLEVVSADHSASLGDSVRFHSSQGHTPGLMMAVIAESLVYCSDLIPGRPWVHLPVTMGYDRYPELLIDEKRAFLEQMMKQETRLFFTHDPVCSMATIRCDERGRFGVEDERETLEGLEL